MLRAIAFGLLTLQVAEALPVRAIKGQMAFVKKTVNIISGLSGEKLADTVVALQDGKVKRVVVGQGREVEFSYQREQLVVRQLETDSDGVTTRGTRIVVGTDFANCRQPFRCLAIAEENITRHVLSLLDNKTVIVKTPADYHFEFRLDNYLLKQRVVGNNIVDQWQTADLEAYETIIKNIEEPEQRLAVIGAIQKISKIETEIAVNVLPSSPSNTRKKDRRRKVLELLGITVDDYLDLARKVKQTNDSPSERRRIGDRFGNRFYKAGWPWLNKYPEERQMINEMILGRLDEAFLDDSSKNFLRKEIDELFPIDDLSNNLKTADRELIDDIVDEVDEVAEVRGFRDKSDNEQLTIIANHRGYDWAWEIMGDDRIVTKSFARYYQQQGYDIASHVNLYHPEFHNDFAQIVGDYKNITNKYRKIRNIKELDDKSARVSELRKIDRELANFNKQLRINYGIKEIKLVNGQSHYNNLDKKSDAVYQFSYGSKSAEESPGHRLYIQQLSMNGQRYWVFLDGFKKEIRDEVGGVSIDELNNRQKTQIIPRAKEYYSYITKDLTEQVYRITKE